MNIAVVTDSTCDLPSEILKKYNVFQAPVHIRIGMKDFLDDGESFNRDDFYRRFLNEKDIDVETEPPTVQEFSDLYARLSAEYDYIVSIHVADSKSKIFKNATEAAYAGKERFKQLRQSVGKDGDVLIRTINSRTTSIALGLQIIRAVEILQKSEKFGAKCMEIEEETSKSHLIFTLEDLYQMRNRATKTGRASVGFMQYVLGSALDIKPVIHLNVDEFETVDKARGFDNAITQLTKQFDKLSQKKNIYNRVGLVYGGSIAEVLKQPDIKRKIDSLEAQGFEVIFSHLSPTLGVYAGPGCIGLAFLELVN